jgi:hypothetical protein
VIAIDIDQTISSGYVGKNLEDSMQYYRARGVEIPEHIVRYSQLFQLPGVLCQHEALPGAIEGVNALAKYRVTYYTVREQSVETITCFWLAQHGFPCSDSVVFCRSVMHKLLQLYEREKGSKEPLFLIDDRWQIALEAIEQLKESKDHQHIAKMLCDRLTVVAFGISSLPENHTELRVVAFPDWSHVVDLLAVIQGGTYAV